ncbi:h/aca ribonucleoprotein complex subunit 2-like protein [Quercus suber]|uniref:H/aca ribonucleoprotein complex subunit 2-like protein n=1 Tax=Quercus suber TaxID=58331 RepID=A0AAW0L0E2_QUESU
MGSDSEAEKTQQKEKERKKLLALAPIAKPLAGKKLCKRTLKLVRREYMENGIISQEVIMKPREAEVANRFCQAS